MTSKGKASPGKDAPKEVPVDARVWGECPAEIRGIWSQMVQVTREANDANTKVRQLEEQLAEAKTKARKLTRQHRSLQGVILHSLREAFPDVPNNYGELGMTADWQVYSKASGRSGASDVIRGILEALSGAGFSSREGSAGMFGREIPDEILEQMLPDGFKRVSRDDLPPEKREAMATDPRVSDDDIVAMNEDGEVAVVKIGGSSMDLAGMLGLSDEMGDSGFAEFMNSMREGGDCDCPVCTARREREARMN